MYRAPLGVVLVLLAVAPSGWTQGEHRHRAPAESPDPFENQINAYTQGDQADPFVVYRPPFDSGSLVVWSSEGQDGSGSGIYGSGETHAIPVELMQFHVE